MEIILGERTAVKIKLPVLKTTTSQVCLSVTEVAVAGFGAYLQPILYGLSSPYET